MSKSQQVEAALVEMRNVLPRMWFALYQGSLEAGFDKSQAMGLVTAHVMGTAAGKVVPPSSNGPESNKPDA